MWLTSHRDINRKLLPAWSMGVLVNQFSLIPSCASWYATPSPSSPIWGNFFKNLWTVMKEKRGEIPIVGHQVIVPKKKSQVKWPLCFQRNVCGDVRKNFMQELPYEPLQCGDAEHVNPIRLRTRTKQSAKTKKRTANRRDLTLAFHSHCLFDGDSFWCADSAVFSCAVSVTCLTRRLVFVGIWVWCFIWVFGFVYTCVRGISEWLRFMRFDLMRFALTNIC